MLGRRNSFTLSAFAEVKQDPALPEHLAHKLLQVQSPGFKKEPVFAGRQRQIVEQEVDWIVRVVVGR